MNPHARVRSIVLYSFATLVFPSLVPGTARLSAQDEEQSERDAAAGDRKEITIEWIHGRKPGEISATASVHWLPDGRALFLDRRAPRRERELEVFDPATGTRTVLVDRARAAASLRSARGLPATEEAERAEKVAGEEDGGEDSGDKSRGNEEEEEKDNDDDNEAGDDEDDEDDEDGQPATPPAVAWPVEIDPTGRRGLYAYDDDLFVLDLASSEYRRITKGGGTEKSAHFSPDGEWLAFVRERDLWVARIENGAERRLTTSDSETILNGTLSWVYWEELFGRADTGYWWSPDAGAIAYLQTDESPVGVVHYVEFKPNVPRVIRQRYPKTGEANPRVRAGVVELETGATTWVDLGVYPYEYLARVNWLPDGKRLAVETLDRAQTALDFFVADRASGAVRHVFRETDPGWVNVHDDLYFLKTRDEFLWASERDGYSHLYRYDLDGNVLNQVTQGEWALRSSGGGPFWVRQTVCAIDEEKEIIYFTALEKSSVEKHLYKVRLDGSDLVRITRDDGTHRITMRPDGEYYFDHFSSLATPPSLTLHHNCGADLYRLAEPRAELVAEYGMRTAELFTIPASDGFAMPATVLKPADFDPARRYPVIFHVYGGPSAPTVENAWDGSYFDQILVREGFLVVHVDNRSATAISKTLENSVLYRGWGAGELADLLDAVRWVKNQSWVDPERVGIWGWSGGGTFTLRALTGSEEFKAGIAVAAVTDWDYYDTKYAESFMKRPRDNPDGYAETSLVEIAGKLHGRLLLVHGTYDDNVHPQNAWAFADALIASGKIFEMMIYPMRQHGISDRPARIHLFKTMLEFWRRNL